MLSINRYYAAYFFWAAFCCPFEEFYTVLIRNYGRKGVGEL